jgi:hypothetical protein
VFCATFFGAGSLLYVLLLLIDPYDTARFPNFGIVGIGDRTLRTADASRGRDPRYNAAVVGNSTGQLLDPYRLSDGTGLRFVQLTIPQTGPQEQLAIMRSVLRQHPAYGGFVVVAYPAFWCSSDPDLPVRYAFPFWLYGGDGAYLANVVSAKALDRAFWRVQIALGLRKPIDPVGYLNYSEESRGTTFAPIPPAQPPASMKWPPEFPWVERLRTLVAGLPLDVRVVVVVPPAYVSLLPEPGTRWANVLPACKAALASTVAGRPRSGFLDFRVDNAETRDPGSFFDQEHYREPVAHEIEDSIIALMRSGDSAIRQAERSANP